MQVPRRSRSPNHPRSLCWFWNDFGNCYQVRQRFPWCRIESRICRAAHQAKAPQIYSDGFAISLRQYSDNSEMDLFAKTRQIEERWCDFFVANGLDAQWKPNEMYEWDIKIGGNYKTRASTGDRRQYVCVVPENRGVAAFESRSRSRRCHGSLSKRRGVCSTNVERFRERLWCWKNVQRPVDVRTGVQSGDDGGLGRASGSVSRPEPRDAAIEIAKGVPGVAKVESRIEVIEQSAAAP